ncbi:MAG TPA: thiamine diphosphokinase [Candidatus Magasanikbacteria bacterium]|nr:MAG: thiamine diphosphokinase [Candidatus Magasanikbacteria bacterium RIFOXYC2_FULL_39_8]HAT03521.1 thiamine diphosphokinase [Candidatus Magasanikbacteria bacterium]
MFEITTIIGTGHVNMDQFLSIYKKVRPLVAADGGANHLYDSGIVPDMIIGDLDSLQNKEEWKQKTNIIHVPDQDSTDLEKVLLRTEAPLYLAFGFTGDRFDHTLEILHVLSKYRNKQIIFFVEDDIVFRIPKLWNIELPIGTRVSLYPLHKTKILKSSGLKWPVDELEMRQGHIIGTSNETTNEYVMIEQDEPHLIGVTEWKFHDKIIATLL